MTTTNRHTDRFAYNLNNPESHSFHRFDCYPNDGVDQSKCEARGCCWNPPQDYDDDKVSISPTFYARHFHTKVLPKAFFSSENFFAQEYWRKCAHKILVKLTKGNRKRKEQVREQFQNRSSILFLSDRI
jgi:hypothetical protein